MNIVAIVMLGMGIGIGLLIGWSNADMANRWSFAEHFESCYDAAWKHAKTITIDLLWTAGIIHEEDYQRAKRILNIE